MRVTGQLNDGSRGSRVTKCDSLSALAGVAPELTQGCTNRFSAVRYHIHIAYQSDGSAPVV